MIKSIPIISYLVYFLFNLKEISGITVCNGINETSEWKGRIQSPNYPHYSPNLNCFWRIEVAKGNVIEARIDKIEMSTYEDRNKYDTTCKNAGDFLKIYDGRYSNATVLGTYCGWQTSKTIQSSSNSLFIQFKTDSTNNYKGFVIEYHGICNRTLNLPPLQNTSGVISSPGYPIMYLPFLKCQWTLIAGPGFNINILVKDFSLESQFYCSYDFTAFFEGKYCFRHKQILKNFCGKDRPPLITNNDTISICFESDFSGQELGMSLAYNISDIDECSVTSPSYCHRKAHCSNTFGSYSCTCKFGYFGDGKNCTRRSDFPFVDECAEGLHNCHPDAICTDTDDEFFCTCKKGYTGNGTICKDIDECKTVEGICSGAHSKCVNFNGSFTCVCLKGFQGDGFNCEDIDECKTGERICSGKHSHCVNLEGSSKCTCKVGYSWDGSNCTDTDECQINGTCHSQALCTNTLGSFICVCDRGFTGNETHCSRLTNVLKPPVWQYIPVAVTHENQSLIQHGDEVPYLITLKHNEVNATDSYSITVHFYLPYFLTFGNCTNIPINTKVKQADRQLTFVIEKLKAGSNISFSFFTIFDKEKRLRKGKHFIVTPISVTWYNEYKVNEGHYTGVGLLHKQPEALDSYSVEIKGCSNPLGMTDGKIKNHQLIASTSLPDSQPEAASFHKTGWCALKTDANPYIQIILATKSSITMIRTWRRTGKPHWVKKYELHYSLDNIKWKKYGENGFTKVFSGNTELFTPVDHWLLYPVEANHIRLQIKERQEMACLRFELYGCSVSDIDNCVDPVGIGNGQIPDEAFSDDLMGSHNPPYNVRLNKKVTAFPFGWQASSGSSPPTYIQVDLGSIFKVTRFAIQGSNNDPKPIFFVKSYYVASSNTSLTGNWKFVRNSNGDKKVFPGPIDDATAKYPFPVFLPTPMYARYFRVYPKNYHSLKVMRMEIYGCVADPKPKNSTELPKGYQRRLILLDKKKNIFFVCAYKRQGTSCYFSSDGKLWHDIHNEIVGIVGLNEKNRFLYGFGKDLKFKYSKDYAREWTYISNKEWSRLKVDTSMIHAAYIEDTLISKEPSHHQWVSSNGFLWGVSGKGIHTKSYAGSPWKLTAMWKCCGQ